MTATVLLVGGRLNGRRVEVNGTGDRLLVPPDQGTPRPIHRQSLYTRERFAILGSRLCSFADEQGGWTATTVGTGALEVQRRERDVWVAAGAAGSVVRRKALAATRLLEEDVAMLDLYEKAGDDLAAIEASRNVRARLADLVDVLEGRA